MSLFNPYILLALVSTVLGAFASGYSKGSNDKEAQQQIEIAAANDKARQTEQNMGVVAQTYAQTLRKTQDVAKAKEIQLRTAVAIGERRLFIPVQTKCPIPASNNSTPATGDSAETRAELDRKVADDLIAIAAEGDAAIRKLNACIDTYEKMRSMK